MRKSDLGAAALAAAGVLVGVFAVGRADPLPQPPRPVSTEVPVRSVELACPPARAAGRSAPAHLAVAAAGAGDTGRTPGEADVQTLPESGDGAVAVLPRPGEARGVTLRPGSAALSVVGTGSLAAALAASEHTVVGSGPSAGMATSACLPSATAWHFLGPANLPGHRGRLVLVNPHPAPAVVDVSLSGPGGALGGAGAEALVVGPDTARVIALRTLVGEQPELALAVRATQGRVVAAVYDRWRAPLLPAAIEWLAPTAAPGRDLVIAGALRGSGRSRLLVSNPTRGEALVDVHILGADGPFRPVGLETLRVPPGAVVARDLPAATSGRVTSVRLAADSPVTAAVRSRLPGGTDVLVIPAGPRLGEPAVVALPPEAGVVVAVANPASSAGVVKVAAYDRGGAELDRAVLDVPGGTTRAWRPPAPGAEGAPAYVVVTPLRGADPVATALLTGRGRQEGLAAALPVRSLPASVLRPPVRFLLIPR